LQETGAHSFFMRKDASHQAGVKELFNHPLNFMDIDQHGKIVSAPNGFCVHSIKSCTQVACKICCCKLAERAGLVDKDGNKEVMLPCHCALGALIDPHLGSSKVMAKVGLVGDKQCQSGKHIFMTILCFVLCETHFEFLHAFHWGRDYPE